MCNFPEIYAELKGWQTGIAALFGFVALILGASWNFHLNRKRDAALRKEEVIAIAAALYGEIILLRKQAAGLARHLSGRYIKHGLTGKQKIDDYFLKAHPISSPMLYEALAPKIGLLPSDLVLAITEFHEKLQDVETWLPQLMEDKERTYNYSVLNVLKPARDAVNGIESALRKIEEMASISKPAETPDIGDTEDVIEMEEEIFRSG